MSRLEQNRADAIRDAGQPAKGFGGRVGTGIDSRCFSRLNGRPLHPKFRRCCSQCLAVSPRKKHLPTACDKLASHSSTNAAATPNHQNL